jgi:phospholipase A1
MKNTVFRIMLILVLTCSANLALAEIPTPNENQPSTYDTNFFNEQPTKESQVELEKSPITKRANKEDKIMDNPFGIAFYKPTYILPYYYTVSPDYAVYRNNTPDGTSLRHGEVKYQLSFKVPIWRDILGYPSTLNFAYSQMSYWQLYNNTAFFRETDYEPEVFFANEINQPLSQYWHINFLNIGASHQSNGYGGPLERSWNRVYIEAITSSENWMVSLKPWLILHDHTYNRYNPDIGKFMGYGQATVAYKYNHQVLSVEARNFIESGGTRATTTLTWSFPLTKQWNGYIQVFSGYGQSLIEYNHRTNSVGVGIALSNWI